MEKDVNRLRLAKEALESGSYDRETIEYIFPELKESEDERIRKAIEYAISQSTHSDGTLIYGVSSEEAIAWLEKLGGKSTDDLTPQDAMDIAVAKCFEQGKQKPTDKVNPKFKDGQWIVWQDKCYKVNYNGCGYELVDQNGLSTSLEYGTIDENAHIWDITKDAKEGDVLTYSDSRNNVYLCIYKEYKNERVYDYCTLDKESFWEHGNWNYLASFNYAPATKEQRDTLEKAMTDAGYTFDFVKKELKKIEQKEDIHNKLTDFEFSLKQIMEEAIEWGNTRNLKTDADLLLRIAQKTSWGEEDTAMLDSAISFVEHSPFTTIGKGKNNVIAWLKSIRDKAQPQSQPKQEWNEEDERIISALLQLLKDCELESNWNCVHYNDREVFFVDMENWLKSIKPLPKKEWSEEDEKYLNTTIAYLKDASEFPENAKTCINWLKSLSPQSTWKPSDEQMLALKMVFDWYNKKFPKFKAFDSLYKQLKKL